MKKGEKHFSCATRHVFGSLLLLEEPLPAMNDLPTQEWEMGIRLCLGTLISISLLAAQERRKICDPEWHGDDDQFTLVF